MTGDRLEVDPASLAKLERLGKVFEGAADDIRKTMGKSLETSAKELEREVPRKGAEKMPRRGGLAARLAAARSRIKVSLSHGGVSVSLEATTRDGYALGKIDTGVVVHRVYGGDVWVSQKVPAHAFSDVFKAGAPEVRRRLTLAMQQQLDELARKAT